MKKIYIHTGQDKTGTSSVQQMLFDNRLKLNEENNISFFTTDIKNRLIKYGNSCCWIKIDKRNVKNDASIVSPEILAQNLAKLPNDVIMSAECFAWIFDKKELLIFKEELSKFFDKIIIIVYIRRQDKQIISLYQQRSKKHRPPSNFFDDKESIAIPTYNENLDYYFDYYKRISRWGDVFGDDNIIF